MDFSSLSEAQQQQLQQLQQQFQEHQLQQQQQQQQQQQKQQAEAQQAQQQQYQDYATQAYDPSQVQAYDQSYYSYYQYQYQDPQQPQHSQHSQQDQQQQQYPYYQTDYANSYQQQTQQPQQHQQPAHPDYPPGVSVRQEAPPQVVESGGAETTPAQSAGPGLGQGQVQVQHQENAYYPQPLGPAGDQSNLGYPVPSGLNPAAAAAVAALSQLTQFAGNMDAAERAMAGIQGPQWHAKGGGFGPMMGPAPGPFIGPGPKHYGPGPMRPPAGRTPFRGGGRRGGGPFRGGGRGNFGNRPNRTGGSGPPFRGRARGRGRGGPRRVPPHAASSSSHQEPSAAEDGGSSEEEAEPSADNHEEEAQAVVPPQTSGPAQGNAASSRRPMQVAWCELCRVDCTSFEILEQHKEGKRHKKNLLRSEELKSANKPVTEIHNEQKPVANSNPEVPLLLENVQEGEEKKNLPENLSTEAVNDESKMESEQKNDQGEQPVIPGEEQSSVQGRKPWINRFDNQRHGMKRKMRGGRGGKRMKTFDAPRRPIEPPKPKVVIPLICDLCNVKCDTQEVFDRHLSGKRHISKLKRFEGHQAMYGPMGLQALYPPNPITQTLFHPQAPQQAFYGPHGSYHPQGAYMPQAHHPAPAATGTGSTFRQNPNPQVPDSTTEFCGQKAVPEARQQSDSVEPEIKQVVTVQTYAGNGVSGSEVTGLNPPLDNSITRDEQVISVTHEAVPDPDYGSTSDHVTLPGLDMQTKDGQGE